MKLCTVIVLLKSYQITKENFKNLTYDVTMTSLLKQWENSDLRETRQIIYHSKGNDESFPKMYLNESNYKYGLKFTRFCNLSE